MFDPLLGDFLWRSLPPSLGSGFGVEASLTLSHRVLFSTVMDELDTLL